MNFETLIFLAGAGLLVNWWLGGGTTAKDSSAPVPVMPADLAAPDVDTPRQGFAALLVVRGALEKSGVSAAEISVMIEPIAPHLLKKPSEVKA